MSLSPLLRLRWAFNAFVASFLLTSVFADTPANCTYEDVHGTWTLYETDRTGDSTIDCSEIRKYTFLI